MSIFVNNVFKNTMAQGVGKFFSVFISIALTAYLTRTLGVEGYGSYTFITSLVLLFGTISDWGTNVITVREASGNTSKKSLIYGSSILFRLILTLISFILLNVLIRINPQWENLVLPTTFASLVLIFLSLKTSASIIFHSILRLELTALSDFLSSIIFFVLVVFLGFIGLTLNSVMLAWAFSTFIVGLVSIYFASRVEIIKWTLDKQVIKKIFWEAAPTGALLLVFSLYNRIDTIILQYFHGSEAVAIYGLPYKMHDTFVLGAAYLMNSLFPYFSREYKNDLSVLKKYYQKAFDILLVSSVILLFGVIICAGWIITVLGGEDFSQSVWILRILSFATFIAYFNHLTGFSLIAFGKQKASLYIALGALGFNLLLNLLFVPMYSFFASAIITVATEGLVLLLSSIVIRKTLGFYPSLLFFPQTIKEILIKKNGK